MKSFIEIAHEQVRVGTTIALACGAVLGALLGVTIISMDNIHLVFPTAMSYVYAVFFLASTLALLAAAVLIPLELVIAVGLLTSSALRRISVAGLYASVIIVGSLFIFVLLWFGFNVIRDPMAPEAVGIYLVLITIAIVFISLINLVWLKIPVREMPDVRGTTLLVVSGLCVALTVISYRSLAGFSKLTEQSNITSVPQRVAVSETASASLTRQNIILISIDTLRADHLSSYGYKRLTSPNIDRLAGDGAMFLNAHSQAPWTLPSHASMFTSLYPSSHGARFSSQHARILDKLDALHLTIAEMLGTAGYRTAAYTSTLWLSEPWGLHQGFGEFEMDPSYTAAQLVDSAIRWVDGDEGRKPFFLFLHFFDVHNYQSPPPFDSRYQDSSYSGKLRGQNLLTSMNGYYSLSDADLAYLIAKYDGALSYVDGELGRLFDWLKAAGLYDKTLILITSDHGEEFWEHGGTGHGFTLYEEVINVPLIVKPAAGNRVDRRRIYEAVGVIDIVPTILDYLGLQRPSSLEGLSLRPLIEGRRLPSRVLFAEDTYYLNTYAIMKDGYKYIENRIPPAEILNPALFFVNLRSFFKFRANELYHVEDDRRERLNLLQAEPEREGRMRENLLTHIQIGNVGQRGTIDEKTQEELRSLGYVQ